MSRIAAILASAVLACALTTRGASAALIFDFNVVVGSNLDDLLTSAVPAEVILGNNVVDGFSEAGELWSDIFVDPITVKVTIDFDTLPAGVLGSTGNETIGTLYSDVRSALISDATSADDATAVANLQPGPSLDFLTNRRSDGVVIRPSGTDVYSNELDVPRATLKALGLLPGNDGGPGADGSITFSDSFSWDFDHTAPITPGFDFVGVAAHEIGHLMGFVSGVDSIDIVTDGGPLEPPFDLNGTDPGDPDISEFSVFSTLDLFRYSAASLAETGQPTTGAVLDLAYGDSPFFSLDAGTTSLTTFATGQFHGDGRQASHWKDNLGIGIMDPTFAPGALGTITSLDERAFDVAGFDLAAVVVPEPNAAGLALLALCWLLPYRTRARRPRR